MEKYSINIAPKNKIILLYNNQWKFPIPAKWKEVKHEKKDGTSNDVSYWAYWPCGDKIGGTSQYWSVLESWKE